MAFTPVNSTGKQRLRFARRPDFKDFNGPRNGDYVRYVDELMRWSEQEQERMRLQALGEKARGMADTQWGRAPSAVQPVAASQPPLPGSVDGALERIKRKAQAKAVQLQQQAAAANAKAGSTPSGKPAITAKNAPASVIIVFLGFVLAAIFKPSLIPVVIIGWVVFNIVRATRAASSRGNKR